MFLFNVVERVFFGAFGVLFVTWTAAGVAHVIAELRNRKRANFEK